MFLNTSDGTAILGYTGLGATSLGTEPADWMSAVLRGRNLSLEQSLGILAEAIKGQLPRHMRRMPGSHGLTHNVIATAFVGAEIRLYTIDLICTPDRKRYYSRYARHFLNQTTTRTYRIFLGGSGSTYLQNDPRWIRPLLRLVRAFESGQISSRMVSDHLASLNNQVHLGTRDNSVGPRCIVAWRYSPHRARKDSPAHAYYSGNMREPDSPSLPSINHGLDTHALVDVLKLYWSKRLGGWPDEPMKELNMDEVNAEVSRLPQDPDEKLR